jgi:hypothetical protein
LVFVHLGSGRAVKALRQDCSLRRDRPWAGCADETTAAEKHRVRWRASRDLS